MLLSSLTELPISSFKKISSSENNNNNKNYFYWAGKYFSWKSGGHKYFINEKCKTEALTFGFDKFTDDAALQDLLLDLEMTMLMLEIRK